MAEKKIYLLRHGDTGRQGFYIGSTDVSLSAIGRQQAHDTAKTLHRKNIDSVYCSPMLRCRQTCEQLDLIIPCQVNELLREVDFGRWEGKSFAEISVDDSEAVDSWTKDPIHFCFPGGEALASFHNRVAAIMKMLGEDTNENILLVTHGGIIRHLLCLCLGIPFEKYLLFDVQPGSFSSLVLHSGGGILTGMNIRG
ncbi:MAG: alpha-ribazole phosphatase [Proteobacteria bacterium]|nr:alpha-ribazole phosphatase [Pseudomonadota bacterium]